MFMLKGKYVVIYVIIPIVHEEYSWIKITHMLFQDFSIIGNMFWIRLRCVKKVWLCMRSGCNSTNWGPNKNAKMKNVLCYDCN